jgi:aconitate hydratase
MLAADSDAEYDRVIEIDLAALEPMAACPSSPDNIRSVSSLAGTAVDQVIVGSCTNGSYRDLMLAAAMLEGRQIHPRVTFAVAPGSRQVLEMISRNGALAALVAAGARVLESACGACIGQGQSPADGTVSVRTFNRNFAGRTGTRGDQAYLVSPATAVAAAIHGAFFDPRELGIAYPSLPLPAKFLINDTMILVPPQVGGAPLEIIRKPTIGAPPVGAPMPSCIEGTVVIKVGDKITTDHIMPAGVHLKHRSNIPEYSKVVFEAFNRDGVPTFAERAAALRDSGRHGVIVGRDSYGQGSSREHAAICPMYLGIRVVLALAIERIHAANLVNFGILPLLFSNPSDYDRIEEGDELVISDVAGQLKVGQPVSAMLRKRGGGTVELTLAHRNSAEDIRILSAGGMLNCAAN